MAITGSVMNHQHNELIPQRTGNFQSEFNENDANSVPANSVLKFPDGTMIQTKSVRFNQRKNQGEFYNKQHTGWNGFKDQYNYTLTKNNDTGYTHDRAYRAVWDVPFVQRPIIFSQYYTNGNVNNVDIFCAINYQKQNNKEIVYQLYDSGGEQNDKLIIIIGIGRWK